MRYLRWQAQSVPTRIVEPGRARWNVTLMADNSERWPPARPSEPGRMHDRTPIRGREWTQRQGDVVPSRPNDVPGSGQ